MFFFSGFKNLVKQFVETLYLWKHELHSGKTQHCRVRTAQCVHCTVGFPCSQNSPVVTTGEYSRYRGITIAIGEEQGNNGAHFVVTTGEYLREIYKFRVWDSRESNFHNVPLNRASWDEYMFSNRTILRLDNKSHRARSRGKKLYNVHIVHWSLSLKTKKVQSWVNRKLFLPVVHKRHREAA